MSDKAVSDALESAADILREASGWYRGGDLKTGHCCMLIAIDRACKPDTKLAIRAIDQLSAEIEERCGYPTIVYFNDKEAKTRKEAVQVMRAAAKRCKS